MRFVWPGHHLERRSDVPQLSLGQPAREVLPDSPEVRSRCLPKHLQATIRKPDQDDPSVAVRANAVDEALPDEAIDLPSKGAGREHHPVRQVGHSELPARRPGQAKQDVVRAEGHPVLRAQLEVELLDDVMVGMQERLPCAELALGQPGPHAGEDSSGHSRDLQVQFLASHFFSRVYARLIRPPWPRLPLAPHVSGSAG
jgi:hypothetical protein